MSSIYPIHYTSIFALSFNLRFYKMGVYPQQQQQPQQPSPQQQAQNAAFGQFGQF